MRSPEKVGTAGVCGLGVCSHPDVLILRTDHGSRYGIAAYRFVGSSFITLGEL